LIRERRSWLTFGKVLHLVWEAPGEGSVEPDTVGLCGGYYGRDAVVAWHGVC
jgi:hypothetical protein